MLETIPGTWRGGEADPGKGSANPPGGRTPPRVPPLLTAIAFSAVTDTPHSRWCYYVITLGVFQTLSAYHQSCWIARWTGKRVSYPCGTWTFLEEAEGVLWRDGCCCCGTRGKVPERSAEGVADDDVLPCPWAGLFGIRGW